MPIPNYVDDFAMFLADGIESDKAKADELRRWLREWLWEWHQSQIWRASAERADLLVALEAITTEITKYHGSFDAHLWKRGLDAIAKARGQDVAQPCSPPEAHP